MDVRNRMADVTKLRCNICQDYLRMILKKDWRQKLYDKASKEIVGKTKYKEKYEPVYEQMRKDGIEEYKVDDMDVTLIVELVLSNFDGIYSAEFATKNSLKQLKEDRNLKSHSGENEEPEELYLRGLLELYNLKRFVNTVDRFEVCIDDNERITFKQKNIQRIVALMETLDEERIEIIHRKKDMDRDVQRVLNSKKPSFTWVDMLEIYARRFLGPGGDTKKFYDFLVYASDSGVPFAHSSAANCFRRNSDYKEAERRWLMYCNSETEIYINDVNDMVGTINEHLITGAKVSNEMLEIVEKLQSKGFNIVKNEDGFYQFIR